MAVEKKLGEIGQILEDLRKKLGQKQEAFAREHLSLGQSQYSKVKLGKYALRGRSLSQLAKKHPEEAREIGALIGRMKGFDVDQSEQPRVSKRQWKILELYRTNDTLRRMIDGLLRGDS
jgi:hypothetical protein